MRASTARGAERRGLETPSGSPPNAVEKNTAGKYGVKNPSGRIRERHHRAAVAKERQEAANPMLKSGDGSDVPCQPRRNSSINFIMDYITSADWRIQNKSSRRKKTRPGGPPQRQHSLRCSVSREIY